MHRQKVGINFFGAHALVNTERERVGINGEKGVQMSIVIKKSLKQ